MQSSPVTVRTNSGFPLSLRSNRCSPAKVAMTYSGLLSPLASLTLSSQSPWAVYSRMPFSFGSAKASMPCRPSRALNVPSESLSQTWKSRAIVIPASGMPFLFASTTQVPSIRPRTYSGWPSWFASVAVNSCFHVQFASIRGRVAQEAQIRSVAEEAAAHLREDDGAHRDHSKHNREPQVQGPWRAFRDAIGFHRDRTF